MQVFDLWEVFASVEPVLVSPNQGKGFGVTGDTRFDESVSKPGSDVVRIFCFGRVLFGIGHDEVIGLLTLFDPGNDLVHQAS